MRAKYIFKVCMFSDKNVGAETFAKYYFDHPEFFKENEYTDRMIKIGNYSRGKTIELYNTTIKLHFWICSLEEVFQFLWPQFIGNSQIIFLMYEIYSHN